MSQVARDIPSFDDDLYEDQCEIASFWTGSRLLVLCSLFLYGTLIFAYFYLRAVNNTNDWRVGNQHASLLIGTVVAVLVIGASGVHYLGARRLQYGGRADWLVASGIALVMLLVAAGLQIWDLTRLPFFPASSGYAGVFIASMPIYILYMLGMFYWLETLVAQAVTRPQTVLLRAGEGARVVPKFGARAEGFVVLSAFVSIISVVLWVLFYVL